MTDAGTDVTTVERAAAAEDAVSGRHLRRVWGLPRTRLAVVGWPASPSQRLLLRWHYWWQAHLLDCVVDAQLRRPDRAREALLRKLIRGHRVRNLGLVQNKYYDDIAWWGLALQRADQAAASVHTGAKVRAIARTLTDAWTEEGGIPWRRGDVFRNTPANGPAAILLARTGNLDRAAQTADWIDDQLRIVGNNLIADGLRPGDERAEVEETIYTYGQGVVLGAELELVLAGRRGAERIHRLVTAVGTHLTRDGVLLGHGGGNGGLFTGILARYLAAVAVALPVTAAADEQCRAAAARLVRSSADALWHNRIAGPEGPLFGPEFDRPARLPGPGGGPRSANNARVDSSRDPERDLSVQLSAWMTLEAAARLDLNGVP